MSANQPSAFAISLREGNQQKPESNRTLVEGGQAMRIFSLGGQFPIG